MYNVEKRELEHLRDFLPRVLVQTPMGVRILGRDFWGAFGGR